MTTLAESHATYTKGVFMWSGWLGWKVEQEATVHNSSCGGWNILFTAFAGRALLPSG